MLGHLRLSRSTGPRISIRHSLRSAEELEVVELDPIVSRVANLLTGKLSEEELDRLFRALSDSTRRSMLRRLATKPMTVGELAEPFEMSKPSISKHLKVLERANLLRRDIDGRVHHCHLVAGPLNEAAQWLQHYEKFWNEKLDALDAHLTGGDDD